MATYKSNFLKSENNEQKPTNFMMAISVHDLNIFISLRMPTPSVCFKWQP